MFCYVCRYTGNLVISDVRKSDEGDYVCRADNDDGQPQASVALLQVKRTRITNYFNRTLIAVLAHIFAYLRPLFIPFTLSTCRPIRVIYFVSIRVYRTII